MKLYEFAQELKSSLKEELSVQTADTIVNRIKKATNNGNPLSSKDIIFIKNYFEFSGYDPETNQFHLNESENEDFLEYVNYIFAQLGY